MRTPAMKIAVCATLLLGAGVFLGCDAGNNGPADGADLGDPPWGELAVAGSAHFFDIGPGPSIEVLEQGPSAEVWMLQYPGLRQAIGADGQFEFTGFAAGQEVTLCLEAPGFQPTQTATVTLGETSTMDLTFQVMSENIRDTVTELLLGVDLDPETCQLATTVTQADTQPMGTWAPGEPGAVVALTPAVAEESGPFYFNEYVIPLAAYTETTSDGGVLYVNVPEGTYLLEGFKDGEVFDPVVLECRAGWLVNASPPYGVQAR